MTARIGGEEVRAARAEEAEAVLEVLSLAFGLDAAAARPLFYADPYFDLACKRVLTLPSAGVVSCLTVVPSLLRIGGAVVPAAGIAGVATRPAFQRRGHAAALLSATVPALWTELRCPVALLHPLSAPFYHKLGWEYGSRQVHWLSAPSSLLQSPRAGCVRPATLADWSALQSLHDTMTRRRTGAFQRDPRRWSLVHLPVPGRETYVYEHLGSVTGYCVWERQDVLHLLEMEAGTDDAQRGLIGFLARQPDALVEWSTSPALLAEFGLSGAGLALEPGVMLRITNLEAALMALHPFSFAPVLALGATLTIYAADPFCPQNTRPLRLSAERVSAAKGSDGPWLRASIGVLARLYFGDWLPSEAAAENALAADSPQTLAVADRLFPLRQPYVAPLDQF